jgi:hypothetical protein
VFLRRLGVECLAQFQEATVVLSPKRIIRACDRAPACIKS